MTNEELVIFIQAGIDVATNMLRLWQQNQGLIGKIASVYSGYEDIEDLKQQGYIGLCNAVEGYKPEEESSFATYAYFWIQQSISRYIENNGSCVRVPINTALLTRRYKRLNSEFFKVYGRKLTDYEAYRMMDISKKRLEDVKNCILMTNISSLEQTIDIDERLTIADTIEGSAGIEEDIVDRVAYEQLKTVLWPLVDKLPDNEPQILRKRFIDNATLKEVGEDIGITVGAVRTIQGKALRHLRNSKSSRVLLSFLPGKLEHIAYSGSVASFNYTWTSSTERAGICLYEHDCFG